MVHVHLSEVSICAKYQLTSTNLLSDSSQKLDPILVNYKTYSIYFNRMFISFYGNFLYTSNAHVRGVAGLSRKEISVITEFHMPDWSPGDESN